MTDAILAPLCRALDLVVIERQPNHTFYPLTPAPEWFSRAFDVATVGERHTLAGAFPFLDDFVVHATDAWAAGPHASLVTGPFAVDIDGEEVLLRATAVTVADRHLLVLERLKGAADTRPMLRKARSRMLEVEQLARQVAALQAPAREVERTLAALYQTPLSPEQQRAADDLGTALMRLREGLKALPAPPPRRDRTER